MAKKRPAMPRPAHASDLLAALLRGTPAEARLKEGKIWSVWTAAVGKKIAERARPVAVRDGVLTVEVSSAPWMQQLTFLKKGIVDKVNNLIGEPVIRDIYLKAGKVGTAPQEQKETRPRRPLSEEECRAIADATAAVDDPELRETFSSLMKKHFSHLQ